MAIIVSMLGGGAFAQPASEEIVVQGQRTADDTVSEFVREVSIEARYGQLTRWDSPVCPLVIGMRADLNHYVAETVRALAREVGAEEAPAECDVNIVIAAASDPGAVVTALRDQRPGLFDNVSMPVRRGLSEGARPVRAWSATHTRGADGRAVERILLSVGSGAAYHPVDRMTGVVPSRIERPTRHDLAVRFVLVDLDRVKDVTMQQLSGLVAVVALAQIDLDEPLLAPTILNLFHDPASAPDDITDWDVAYLRGLYRIELARAGAAQRGVIAREMRQELESAADR